MLRALFATVLGGVLVLPLISSAGQEPPSSLEPVHRGFVSFSHDASRVIACTPKTEQKKLECVAQRQPADASATLTLRPVIENTVGMKDKRDKVQVALPQDGGHVQKIELGVGIWEIEWPGRSERDRFYVAEADDFAVQLRTEVGACQKKKDDCVLKTDKTVLSVKIPKRCRR